MNMELYSVLKSNVNKKPLDIGCGSLTASIKENGTISTINAYHPTKGYLTLSSLETFSNGLWYDSEYVRAYRKRIAGFGEGNRAHGFGFSHNREIQDWHSGYTPEGKLVITYKIDQLNLAITFEAIDASGRATVVQSIEIKNNSTMEQTLPFQIGGIYNLNRCSYGQLTEGGPIQMPEQINDLEIQGNRMSLRNPSLPAQVVMTILEDGQPFDLGTEKRTSNEPIKQLSEYQWKIAPSEVKQLLITYTINTEGEALNDAEWGNDAIFLHLKDISMVDEPLCFIDTSWSHYVIRRNVAYILNCCSVPVQDEQVCVITDHQLLPLSWNRDSYYMMRLLIDVDEHEGILTQAERSKVRETIKGHLLWMFMTAERPSGYWGRAYLTNGYCKDDVYQLDQQCYPLLELCEYYEWTNDKETVVRLLPYLEDTIQEIMKIRHEQYWLFRTGETPADDKVDYPYHFSSQILMWQTLRKLDALNKEIPFTTQKLHEWVQQVQTDCFDHFTIESEGKRMFAYLVDLQGNHTTYHDANDLPTVLAPIWGFCDADDSRWINTMEFAFSTRNIGGYYEGIYGGLGSIHTPHPWPLGDAQQLIYSALINDQDQYTLVIQKLKQLCQWDGLYSEAVHEQSGEVASRHWFSWPGAFISQALLLNKQSNI
ncbi:glycoside hydrolase family 125 protein [Paenibacillus alginolyticus]|uniref:Glycoside hydrolase family 125 protein n=1 Tax=Paenibacillus alginolyticus TaxID=59839 RepID=A0ABT4G590_9BACL|nr:glycoside hydrolase family 125 protein [Paenibacillus alginolyticus]MCY9670826.1 glycoside hydrolase family 125 protein [Paenibacillus alginolyticus]MCY9691348.1 glycoside hydrolase family 125 protein [Paenibacillus alginolyticus]MEC0146458.1 glycoside hydrolase family 125 protein [Paenibacillus alginolyticus]